MKNICLCAMLTVCMFAVSTAVHAQSLKDLFKKETLESVLSSSGSGSTTSAEFIGNWNYTGSAVGFKTDDLLKKAGGAVASAAIKTKMDEQLVKYGVKPGSVEFTFNEDDTFTCVLNKKTVKGTYAYDSNTSVVNFTFAGFFTLDSTAKLASPKMTLMFDADKLLLLLNYFGQQSNDTTLKTIADLASQYDGMSVGLEIEKK